MRLCGDEKKAKRMYIDVKYAKASFYLVITRLCLN